MFEKVFTILQYRPCVHEYVYKNEMFFLPMMQSLVQEKRVEVLEKHSIVKSQEQESLYALQWRQLYHDINGTFPSLSPDSDVFSFRESGKNLGEIHSLLSAKILGIPYFCSNDHGSKYLAKRLSTSKRTVTILTLHDVVEQEKVKLLLSNTQRRGLLSLHK